jgi:hypothetical protein
MMLEEQRAVRVPYAAVVLLLIHLPLMRLYAAVRQHRRQKEPKPSLAFAPFRWAVAVAIGASAVLCLGAAWEWFWSYRSEMSLAWQTSWPAANRSAGQDSKLNRHVVITRRGYEVARSFVLYGGQPQVPESGTYNVVALRPGGPAAVAFGLTGGGPTARGAGFVFEREDASIPGPFVGIGGLGMPGRRVGWLLVIPHWMVVLVLATLPTLWLFRRFRADLPERRRRRGLCPACGYDVRATPDLCPECGHRPNVVFAH